MKASAIVQKLISYFYSRNSSYFSSVKYFALLINVERTVHELTHQAGLA